MFRDILSGSRAIFIGVVFFVVVVGGSSLYSWHVHRTTDAELSETRRKVQPLKNAKAAHTTQDTTDTSTVDFEHVGTDIKTDDAQAMSDDTGAAPNNDAAPVDLSEAFLPDDFVSEEAPVEDVPVSPYGFGPFPEVPSDYPDQDVWSEVALRSMKPGHELISRVRIELWNQGVRTLGGVYDNGHRLIYPIIDDVVYIEWADNLGIGGKPYVRRQLTTSAVKDQYHDDILKGIFPPHLTIYEFPDGGIDPYEFLDLPR